MRLKSWVAPIKGKEPPIKGKEPGKEPRAQVIQHKTKKAASNETAFFEVRPGLEPGNQAFAEPSLTNLGTSPMQANISKRLLPFQGWELLFFGRHEKNHLRFAPSVRYSLG